MAKSLGPDHFDVSRPLIALGNCRGKRLGHAVALPFFEQALAIRLKNPGKAASLAEVQWILARSLVLLGRERERALGLARAAVENFRKADTNINSSIADQIAGWLERGAPATQLPKW
jgi:hypothetical protein